MPGFLTDRPGSVIYKMSGSGNDFVMLDGRDEPVDRWPADRIRDICARGTGVGADGLVILAPGSRSEHVRFRYFNSDGSPAPMCGNGALCAVRLAAWLELAPAAGMVLETDAGPVRGRWLDGPEGCAEIGLPDRTPIQRPPISGVKGETGIYFTTVGVPHLVVLVEDVAEVPLPDRGRELRAHPAMEPGGANVNFVCRHAGEWLMRTYERGVEAETLACGTGAAAVAAVLAHLGDAVPPIRLHSASGSLLTISATNGPADQGHRLTLAAPAALVFRAVIGG